jgi:hypothetical protein
LIPQQGEKKGAKSVGSYIRLAISGLALAAQVTGFVLWPVFYSEDLPRFWLLPIALLFISCGWWENYIGVAKIPGKHDKIKNNNAPLFPGYRYIPPPPPPQLTHARISASLKCWVIY